MSETMMKAKTKARAKEEFSGEVLDELLQGVVTQQDLLGDGGTVKRLTKALLERVLQAELSHHLESGGIGGHETHFGRGELGVR